MTTFTELVYDDRAKPFIRENFPDAVFEDASDDIHEGRFTVILPEEQEDDFYVKMLLEGWARSCFGFEMMILDNDSHDQVRHLLDLAIVAIKEKG